MYQSRIDLLSLFLTNGQISKLSQSEVYQKFSSFIDYEKTFQGIREVLLNSGGLEAVAKISLPPNKGTYVCDPRWLDNFTQVPSLVVNCSHDCTAEARFTCRGWNRMHILLPLKADTIYRVHVRMQSYGQTDSVIGDLHVLDEAGRAAAVIKHIQFKPVSGSKLNKATPSLGGTSQIEILNGAANSAYASNGQTPNFFGTNGAFTNSPQAPSFSEANGNGQYAPVVRNPKPNPTQKAINDVRNSVLMDEVSNEPPRLSSAVKGDVPDKIPISVLASPEPAPELLRNGKASNGGRSGAIDFGEILALMAEEIGVKPDSLDDDVLLDDLGVDSIIQISLIARIQKYLAKPLSPGLLMEFNSIAKLRRFFATH